MRQILDAAWEIAREDGLGAVTLHEVARRVGIRQPSLYVYVDSKNGLFDAMFAEGYQQLLDDLSGREYSPDPRTALKQMTRHLVDFNMADVPRCLLMFARTIPGFEPSAEAYAHSLRFQEWSTPMYVAAGLTEPEQIEIAIGVTAGMISTQMANEPHGRRYVRHLDGLLDLILDQYANAPDPPEVRHDRTRTEPHDHRRR